MNPIKGLGHGEQVNQYHNEAVKVIVHEVKECEGVMSLICKECLISLIEACLMMVSMCEEGRQAFEPWERQASGDFF